MRFFGIVFALLLSVALSGCWDSLEVNDLAIVGAIGIDLDEEGLALLSLEVLNPAALARGTQAAAGLLPDIVGWIIQEPLTTFGEAEVQLSRRIPRYVYLGHAVMTVFGQAAAEAGVAPWIDYLSRNQVIRRSMFVSVCDTGIGLLQRPLMEDTSSLTLAGLVQTTKRHSVTRPVTLNEFLRKLREPGYEPVAMHTVGRATHDLYLTKEGLKSTQMVGKEEQIPRPDVHDPRSVVPEVKPPSEMLQGSALPQTEQTIFAGLSVFHGDRLVGFLDGLQARGFMWLTGGMSGTWIPVPHPTSKSGTCVVQLVKHRHRIRATVQDGRPLITCSTEAQVQLVESNEPINLLDPSTLLFLERATAAVIESEARFSLTRVQSEFRSDVYGFGAEVHRSNPKYWNQVAGQWDEIFPEVPVEIKVEVMLRGDGIQISDWRRP